MSAEKAIGKYLNLIDIAALEKMSGRPSGISALITSSQHAVFTMTLDGVITTWNLGAERTYGFPEREAVGRSADEIAPLASGEAYQSLLARIRNGEIVQPFDVVGNRKDGARIELLQSLLPVLDRDGAITGVTAIAENVAARKREEQSLRENEQRLRLALDAGRMGTWVWDFDADVALMDRQECALCGLEYMDGPRSARTFFDLVHPDDMPLLKKKLDQTIHSGARYEHEFRIVRPDGSVRWLAGRGEVVHDTDGHPLKMTGVNFDVTDQRKTVQLLADHDRVANERLAELEAIYRSIPVGLCFVDCDLRYRKVNEALAAINGRSVEDHYGKHVREVLPKSLADIVEEKYKYVLRTGKAILNFELECPPPAKPNDVHHWQLCYYAVTDDKGHIFGANAVVQDITERKRAESALQESEARFRTMADNSPVMVWVSDRGGQCTYLNRAWYEFTGMNAERSLGAGWMDAVHPADRELRQQAYARATVRQKPFRLEYRLRTVDGCYRWVLDSAVPRLGESNRLLGFIGSLVDITEHKKAEETLRRDQEQLQSAIIGAPIPIIIHTEAGEILALSDSALDQTGYRREQIGSFHDWVRLVHPDRRDEVLNLVATSFAQDRALSDLELPVQTRSGAALCWRFRAEPPQRLPDGRKYYVVMATDITDIRQAERDLHDENRTLEDRVAERARVAERQAAQLRRLAMRLSSVEQQDRRRIADLIHGELQQYLVAAMMRFEMLKHHLKGSKGQSLHAEASTLLRSAIDEARATTIELSPPILRHSGFADSLEWISHWMLDRYKLRVILDVDRQYEPETEELKTFLFTAVQELLLNVVKHADTETANITSRQADQQHWELKVEDDGIGCKQDSWKSSKGSGFGLYTIAERLLALGCQVKFKTAPGQGFSTAILIPYSPEKQISASRPAFPMTPLPPRSASTRAASQESASDSLRLLVVDDHSVVREGLVKLLDSQPDLRVIGEASNGKDAVRLARRMEPDVIIMDVNMQGLSGIDAARIITEQVPDTIVIGLSVNADRATENAMINAGAAAYLTKDEDAEVLCNLIRDIVSARRNAP